MKPDIKQRYGWYFLQSLVMIIVNAMGYGVLGSLFVKIPQDYQWILALCTPLVKDAVTKIVLAVSFKSAGKDAYGKASVKFPAIHYVSTKHAIFLAVIVGGVATPATSFCIIVTDFLKAIYTGWKITRKFKTNQNIDGQYHLDYISILESNLQLISDDAMKLVINERKSLNALTYLILIIMAYYGPNAELLGNIKLSIWQFERPILDIETYVSKVSLLMTIDVLSFIINGGMLWYSCKVNIFNTMKKVQKYFWIVFAITEAFHLVEVTSNNCEEDVAFDMDIHIWIGRNGVF